MPFTWTINIKKNPGLLRVDGTVLRVQVRATPMAMLRWGEASGGHGPNASLSSTR
jgi:hypothetical protein